MPQIVALPIMEGSEKYLRWLAEEVERGKKKGEENDKPEHRWS